MARAASQPQCHAPNSYQRAPNPAVHHFLHLLLCVRCALNRCIRTLLQRLNLRPMHPRELLQLRYQDLILRAKISNQFLCFIE